MEDAYLLAFDVLQSAQEDVFGLVYHVPNAVGRHCFTGIKCIESA